MYPYPGLPKQAADAAMSDLRTVVSPADSGSVLLVVTPSAAKGDVPPIAADRRTATELARQVAVVADGSTGAAGIRVGEKGDATRLGIDPRRREPERAHRLRKQHGLPGLDLVREALEARSHRQESQAKRPDRPGRLPRHHGQGNHSRPDQPA